jgi:signal transduction histidine kinase
LTVGQPGSGGDDELGRARREAEYYRRIAEEAGTRRLREAEVLSRLLERAEQAERELGQAREELERRVAERTAELSAANDRLCRAAADRERAEEELRASEEVFRSFMVRFPGLAYIKEADTTVVFASEGFRTYMGFDPEAMVGKPNAACLPEPLATQVTRDDLRVLASGLPETINEEFGGRSWITRKFVIPRADGALRLGGLTLDVTEARRSEEERRRLERQMEQLQRTESLGVLAGGIAHDFNNLLATILANASILRAEGTNGAEAAACLADVEVAARTAAGLCQRMLAYAGRSPSASELLDLSDLVRDLVQLLRSSISRKLALDVQLEEGLPLLRGDPSQLRQVVMNLVINAAEAMVEGSGTVAVSTGLLEAEEERLRVALLGQELPGGTYLFLDVADTGCGMDPATQRRIFEPFFTSKFAGRGLGLSAVLGIVRQLGGAIELESAVGKGTHFRVLLPTAAGAAVPAARSRSAADGWTGEGLVLVVDDEPSVRRAAGRLLARLGFQVLEAAGGAEGVEIFTARAPRVRAVLLDLTMPHQDGVETFRRLRQVDPSVRVLVASGYAEAEVRLRFGAEQPDGLVQKPFDLEVLRSQLRAILEAGRRGRGAG